MGIYRSLGRAAGGRYVLLISTFQLRAHRPFITTVHRQASTADHLISAVVAIIRWCYAPITVRALCAAIGALNNEVWHVIQACPSIRGHLR
jgi:hypothetical protein